MTPLDWLLAAAAVLSVGFLPACIARYRRDLRYRRLREVHSSLWDEDAVKHYRELFCPPGASRHEPIELTIEREFHSVHGVQRYLFPMAAFTLLTGAAVAIVFAWAHWKLTDNGWFSPHFNRVSDQIVLALAGAYVWTTYEVLGRIRSRELTPHELLEVSLRIIAAIPIGWACSLLAGDDAKNILAFAAAAFPLRDIRRFMRQRTLRDLKVEGSTLGARTASGHLANVIEGVGEDAVVRLEELEIQTFIDLAYVDPVRLMARTGIPLRVALTWIDQALLATYAPTLKVRLAELGMPCALDASEFYERHGKDANNDDARADAATDPYVVKLAEAVKLSPELLLSLLRCIHVDPHVRFLAAVWYSKVGDADAADVGRPPHIPHAAAG